MSIRNIGAGINKGFEAIGRKISGGEAAGKGVLNRLAKLNEPVKNAVNPTMFAVALYGCVLFPRAAAAGKRSKTEKREVITRDAIGLTTLVFAMKAINGGIAKAAEKATGLILTKHVKGDKTKALQEMSPLRKFAEYVRPAQGVHVLSTDQIVSNYRIQDTNGLKKLVTWLGGGAGKALTVDAGKKNAKLATLTTQLLGKDAASKTSEQIIEAIGKNSEKAQEIVEVLSKADNPLIQKAKLINSGIIKTIGLGVVVAVLGVGLPMFNKYLTKKLDAKKEAGEITHEEWQREIDFIYSLTPEQTNTYQNFLGVA